MAVAERNPLKIFRAARARAPAPRMSTAADASSTHELNGTTISGPLVPARNYLMVRVASPPETTTGGLILSTAAVEKPSSSSWRRSAADLR